MYKIKIVRTASANGKRKPQIRILKVALFICLGVPAIGLIVSGLSGADLLDGLMGSARTNTPTQELLVGVFIWSFLAAPYVALVYAITAFIVGRRRQEKLPASERMNMKQATMPLVVIGILALAHAGLLLNMFNPTFYSGHFTQKGRCLSVEESSVKLYGELSKKVSDAKEDCIKGSISAKQYDEVVRSAEAEALSNPDSNKKDTSQVCTYSERGVVCH